MDLAGSNSPFLVTSGAYATFTNCFFCNVDLHRSAVFEVSMGGFVALFDCHFFDISTTAGLVDVETTHNDYRSDYILNTYFNLYNDLGADLWVNAAVYGQDGHEAYDIALAPAQQYYDYGYASPADAFYGQYFDYGAFETYHDQAPSPASNEGPNGAPRSDNPVRSRRGKQLSTDHPWFQAVVEVCTGHGLR